MRFYVDLRTELGTEGRGCYSSCAFDATAAFPLRYERAGVTITLVFEGLGSRSVEICRFVLDDCELLRCMSWSLLESFRATPADFFVLTDAGGAARV